MWDRVHPGWTGSLIIARALMKELEKSKSTAKTSMNVYRMINPSPLKRIFGTGYGEENSIDVQVRIALPHRTNERVR